MGKHRTINPEWQRLALTYIRNAGPSGIETRPLSELTHVSVSTMRHILSQWEKEGVIVNVNPDFLAKPRSFTVSLFGLKMLANLRLETKDVSVTKLGNIPPEMTGKTTIADLPWSISRAGENWTNEELASLDIALLAFAVEKGKMHKRGLKSMMLQSIRRLKFLVYCWDHRDQITYKEKIGEKLCKDHPYCHE